MKKLFLAAAILGMTSFAFGQQQAGSKTKDKTCTKSCSSDKKCCKKGGSCDKDKKASASTTTTTTDKK